MTYTYYLKYIRKFAYLVRVYWRLWNS